jgi:hypothetical protein
VIDWLLARAKAVMAAREPDFVIGEPQRPYLRRWFIIPRNPLCNIYLHEILRSDDDRALHDHPWWNFTIILRGGYCEHTIDAGGIHHRRWRWRGDMKLRWARAAHRLDVPRDGGPSTLTMFFTGPRIRAWGFHCPDAGWVHWQEFTKATDKGQIGRGCGE